MHRLSLPVRRAFIAAHLLFFLFPGFLMSLPTDNRVPLPRKLQDSLIVFYLEYRDIDETRERVGTIVFEKENGKKLKKRFTGGDGDIVPFKIKAGRYKLRSIRTDEALVDTEAMLEKSEAAGFEIDFLVGLSTVLLYESKIIIGPDDRISLEKMRPEDRRKAAAELIRELPFFLWSGSSYVGFGPFSPEPIFTPKTFMVQFDTEPQGTELILDDESYGTTPLSAELSSGEHQLELIYPDETMDRKKLNISGNESFRFLATKASGRKKGVKLALVVPFRNEGDPAYDYLSSVFSDSLALTVSESGKIVTVHPSPKLVEEAEALPRDERYFRYVQEAEEAGADLIIDGGYSAGDEEVLTRGIVYDVSRNLVQTSTLYTGPAGLDIFDSIDEMALSFAEELDRVLPEIGQKVIRLEESKSEETLRFQRSVAQQKIMAARDSRRFMGDIGIGFGGSDLDRDLNISGDDDYYRDGMTLGPMASFTYLLKPRIGLYGMTGFLFLVSEERGTFELPLTLGPVVLFPSRAFDVTFGILPQIAYCSEFSSEIRNFGPFLRSDLLMDFGISFYGYDETDDPMRYIKLNFQVQLIGATMDYDFSDPQQAGFMARLYLSIGRRL